jgi:hypothetical protein
MRVCLLVCPVPIVLSSGRQHEQTDRRQNHVKVFANVDASEKWFENDPEGVAFDCEVLE